MMASSTPEQKLPTDSRLYLQVRWTDEKYREPFLETFARSGISLEQYEDETLAEEIRESFDWFKKQGLIIWQKILSDEQKAAVKSEYKSLREQGLLTKVLGGELPPPPNASPKQEFCKEEGGRYVAIDGKSLKKSPSRWSLHDYPCDACGKTFTQCHTLHKHKRHHCKKLPTAPPPKEECPGCRKTVHKSTLYQHAKHG